MTPANRLLLVIGGGLVLLVVVAFIAYPLFRRDETSTPIEQVRTQDRTALEPKAADNQQVDSGVISEIPATDAAQRAEVERLARMFVERFGSYSNYSNFSNISSLLPFMTQNMKSFSDNIIQNSTLSSQSEYVGVTTRIVSLSLVEFNNQNNANLSFTVLREDQNGLESPIQRQYKDGNLLLVYSNGQWLVDRLAYKE